jgi:hypothetical protein
MCDCLAKCTVALREKYDDPAAMIDCFTGHNTMLPYGLCGFYRKKNKDGSYKKNKIRVTIQPTYCPFCGAKYE